MGRITAFKVSIKRIINQCIRIGNKLQPMLGSNKAGSISFGEEYKLILFLLKIVGSTPISFGPVSNGGYHIKYFQLSTICAALLTLYLTYVWVIFLFDVVFENPIICHSFRKPMTIIFEEIIKSTESKPNLEFHLKRAIKSLYICLCLTHTVETYLSWFQASKFVRFINNWTEFEEKFKTTFPNFKKDAFYLRLSKYRKKLLLLYVLLPTFVIWILNYIIFSDFTFIQIFFVSSINLSLVMVSHLDDLIVLFTYKIVATAFQMIQEGIKNESEILETKIPTWRSLVCFVRTQCAFTGQIQKVHQLWIYGNSIIFLTGSLFIILNISWENAFTLWFAVATFIFSSVSMIRAYFKTTLAQQITFQEYSIVQILNKKKTNPADLKTSIELKYLCSIIESKPSVISFGTYIVLDKKLLLQMFSQVLSYLVILMQYSQVNM